MDCRFPKYCMNFTNKILKTKWFIDGKTGRLRKRSFRALYEEFLFQHYWQSWSPFIWFTDENIAHATVSWLDFDVKLSTENHTILFQVKNRKDFWPFKITTHRSGCFRMTRYSLLSFLRHFQFQNFRILRFLQKIFKFYFRFTLFLISFDFDSQISAPTHPPQEIHTVVFALCPFSRTAKTKVC